MSELNRQNTYFQTQLSNFREYLQLEYDAKPKIPPRSITDAERLRCNEIDERMRLLRANDRAAEDRAAAAKRNAKVAAAALQVARRKLKAAVLSEIKRGVVDKANDENDESAFEWVRILF